MRPARQRPRSGTAGPSKTLLTARACARAVTRKTGRGPRGISGRAQSSADYQKVEDDYHALKLGAMLYELEES